MKLNYKQREIFWGNEALVVADMAKGSEGAIDFTNVKIVTGLVSVGAMEDQAETQNFPADDVPDHGVKKGATLLQGEMVFIQTDEVLKEDMLGQKKSANGLGWSATGNWKTKCVQYLIKGRRRTLDGGFEDGWRVVVYPNLSPTAEATSESETDSVDGVDPIQWTLAVQATESDIYLNDGVKVAKMEYEIWGEQAKNFADKMEEGLFIIEPDTVIKGGGASLVAPTIADVETATTGGNDGTASIPTSLQDTAGSTVQVTSVLETSAGAAATNGQLAPGAYKVTFSAAGYDSVTATFNVTDKA